LRETEQAGGKQKTTNEPRPLPRAIYKIIESTTQKRREKKKERRKIEWYSDTDIHTNKNQNK
jgi:hypothetical protein